MNAPGRARRLTRLVALAGALAAGALGCGLLLDFDPPEARHLECLATVENAEGVRVDLSSLDHPDFVDAVPAFGGGGGGGPGGGAGTAPMRPFYVCEAASCSDCSYADAADAEVDWRRWLATRIGEIAAAAPSASLFSMHPGPWCVVPGTVRCEPRERVDRDPSCGPPLVAAPLADCGGMPPPTDQCLELSCRGGAPCSSIDFGLQPTGSRTAEVVTLRNCGDPTQLPVRVQVDPTVMPITLDAEFEVARNDCAPRTPMEVATGRVLALASVDPAESACELELAFAPANAGLHEARIAFASDVEPSHRILLMGQVAGGGLALEGGDVVCLPDAPPGGCSPERVLRLTNGGPGTVTITAIRMADGIGDLFVRRPPPPSYPIVLAPGSPPVEVSLQWCPGGPGVNAGSLVIDSNADPPFEPRKIAYQDPANCP